MKGVPKRLSSWGGVDCVVVVVMTIDDDDDKVSSSAVYVVCKMNAHTVHIERVPMSVCRCRVAAPNIRTIRTIRAAPF